jgi:hypothetical protein
LVVTSLPIDGFRDRVTVFAGLHPAGTRAIDLILSSPHLLEELSRKTRRLPAWQALIEVRAGDSEYPISVGGVHVFEISNVDFDDPNLRIRKRLMLDEATVAYLAKLLPRTDGDQVDYLDSMVTGMVGLHPRKLYKYLRDSMLLDGIPPAIDSKPIDSVRPRRRAIDRLTLESPPIGIPVSSNPTLRSSQTRHRRPGRPKSMKTSASLVHRLEIRLSDDDLEMLAQMQSLSGGSMGQAIRDAIRNKYERLKTK